MAGDRGMSLPEIADEMARLSRLLDQGLAALRDQARELAEAEREYRRAKAQAWVTAPEGTVPQREAFVNGVTADLRYVRDLADGMRSAALEAVRSRRTQVSALQSLLAAHRAEAEFDRTYEGAA
jgi:hypothetical protein